MVFGCRVTDQRNIFYLIVDDLPVFFATLLTTFSVIFYCMDCARKESFGVLKILLVIRKAAHKLDFLVSSCVISLSLSIWVKKSNFFLEQEEKKTSLLLLVFIGSELVREQNLHSAGIVEPGFSSAC
jgi:hypothetical protein